MIIDILLSIRIVIVFFYKGVKTIKINFLIVIDFFIDNRGTVVSLRRDIKIIKISLFTLIAIEIFVIFDRSILLLYFFIKLIALSRSLILYYILNLDL